MRKSTATKANTVKMQGPIDELSRQSIWRVGDYLPFHSLRRIADIRQRITIEFGSLSLVFLGNLPLLLERRAFRVLIKASSSAPL